MINHLGRGRKTKLTPRIKAIIRYMTKEKYSDEGGSLRKVSKYLKSRGFSVHYTTIKKYLGISCLVNHLRLIIFFNTRYFKLG